MANEINNSQQHEDNGNSGAHSVKVTVEHLASLQEVTVHGKLTDTVQHVWTTAYTLLGEPHRDGDRLQTDNGVDLTPFLTSTLHHIQERLDLKSLKFQIVGPTGGASK